MLSNNVAKCMLNVASTMLPATFGQRCCGMLPKCCLVYALLKAVNMGFSLHVHANMRMLVEMHTSPWSSYSAEKAIQKCGRVRSVGE